MVPKHRVLIGLHFQALQVRPRRSPRVRVPWVDVKRLRNVDVMEHVQLTVYETRRVHSRSVARGWGM